MRPPDRREGPIPTLAVVLVGDDYMGWSAIAFNGESGWMQAMATGERRWIFGGPTPVADPDPSPPLKIEKMSDAISRCEAFAFCWLELHAPEPT